MSEHSSSFGGLAVADPQPATSPLDLGSDTESTDNRRKLALVGAVVAVLVVLIAAFFMLKGKGNSDNALGPVPSAAHPASTGTAATATAAAAPKPIKLPKPFAGVVGRDPFKPLYVAPAAPAGGSAKAPTTGTTTVPTVPVVVTPTGGASNPTVTPTQPTATNNSVGPNFAPVWVALVKVNGTKSATFVVGYSDGKRTKDVTYSNVAAPTSLRTVFARVFSLLSIQNGTATVQVGDGTPFDLSRGFNNRHFIG